ncbi:Cof-type HAD-IIB family hydrolase [Allocoprobacillus halotolerans]|uniref:Cof-type HAD-IIB family hydrolase n=1 Tax=Allocoprobacillus halotolerans TaxID=2944914 RepID=A0ABY5HYT3_9FIRM|nr:HAD family hydrolase [Allocoprobacillus halotolerans]UTY38239.1 Cof-type HAD-IIB family hydrolase [Allocoprobacillus halotolerans]
MGKFLFFDIDGTLVGKSKMVTEKTKQAIQQARQNGHRAFLCTGRAPTSLVGDIREIAFDGAICSAGGFVIVDGEYIFENFMNQYILSEVMTLFINNHILFTLETKEALYQTPGVNEFFDQKHQKDCENNLELMRFFQLRRMGENRLPIKDFDILKTGVTKVCFIAPNKQSFYDCVPFLEEFFNIVTFSKEEDDFINGEIILKYCTKADGILKVVNHFKGQMKDTIGFGDSMNDYQMLQEVETGVVYEGASDNLKALGKYFFTDPDQDGIYKVMKEMGLID